LDDSEEGDGQHPAAAAAAVAARPRPPARLEQPLAEAAAGDQQAAAHLPGASGATSMDMSQSLNTRDLLGESAAVIQLKDTASSARRPPPPAAPPRRAAAEVAAAVARAEVYPAM
jgi:hypothetical protein